MFRDLSRRDTLRGGAVAVVAAVAGCDMQPKKSGGGGGTGGGNAGGGGPNPKEAPMLAAMVKRGKLPPVKKRLPPEPVVIQPLEGVGKYGGQWRQVTEASGYGTGATQYQLCGYENLVRWDPMSKKIIGCVADSWEIANGGKEYTFKLHPGIKWSDGQPFTADDVVFAHEDVLNNTDLWPVPHPYYGRAKAEKIDDNTVKLSWDKPNGLLLTYMATREGVHQTQYPKHYMKQFHKKYNPDVEKEAKKEQFDNWVALFQQKGGDWSFGSNPGKPTIYAWLLKTNTKTQVTVERNPYYWKVDSAGSQLPYLDGMVWAVITDPQTAVLKAGNGEIDWSYEEPVDKPVLARSRSKGKYRFFNAVPAHSSDQVLMPNLAHKDPVMREINNNKNFRIGLSYAINRKSIIDAVFQRQGEAWQMAPRKESSFYNETLATQYLEYDVDKANEYLDKAYPKKSSEGIRLGPDGNPITFQIDVVGDNTTWVDSAEIVVGDWKKVGVDARLKNLSADLAVTRGNANSHDWAIWSGEGGLDAVILVNPYNYLPTNPPYSFFGVTWANWWRSHGKEGDEPPAQVRHQLDLYDQLTTTVDPDEQHRLMTEILKICQEQFFVIGTEAPTISYGIVSDRTHNFPKDNVMNHGTVWVYEDPAPTNVCQYYIDE